MYSYLKKGSPEKNWRAPRAGASPIQSGLDGGGMASPARRKAARTNGEELFCVVLQQGETRNCHYWQRRQCHLWILYVCDQTRKSNVEFTLKTDLNANTGSPAQCTWYRTRGSSLGKNCPFLHILVPQQPSCAPKIRALPCLSCSHSDRPKTHRQC